MTLAFIVMGGFLYWLYLQAADQRAQEAVQMQQAAAEKANSFPNAHDITGTALETDAGSYLGQLVKTEELPVASGLGTRGFWLELPNKNPFLVALNDSLLADSTVVDAGQHVVVVGTMYAMNDSAVNAWVKSGSIGEGDKLAAEFATQYLEARHVQVVTAGGSGGEG
jgi:hypothetical protein